MIRSRLSLVGAVLAFLLACPEGTQAARPTGQPAGNLRAVLAGAPIPLVAVGRYHCHDMAYPEYRCFRKAEARDRDMARTARLLRAASAGVSGDEFASASVGPYVRAYEHSSYGGWSVALSYPVPDLGAIGWDNQISSFKSTSGGRPKWWDYTNYTGDYWQWPLSAWVSYVGNGANDTFTSVKHVM